MKTLERGGYGFLFFLIIAALLLLGYVWFSQSGSKDAQKDAQTRKVSITARVEFEGLPVSRNWHYELWERNPYGGEQRIGGMRVREGGTTVTTLAGEPLTEFVLYEYPSPDSEFLVTVEEGLELVEQRSKRVVLSGVLERGIADLRVPALETEETQYAILESPTSDQAPGDAGAWFDLSLPDLPEGWVYRGWVITSEGQTIPMGSFLDASTSGEPSLYDGPGARKNIPGGDFVQNPPEGIEFPLSLSDGRSFVIISMDPDMYDPIPGQLPFLPIFSVRIPFGQRVGAPFELPPVEFEEMPFGVVKLKKID